MKYGFVAFGKMKPEITGDNVKDIMKKVVKISEKYDINVIMYGFPFGVSEDFLAVYSSDKGLDNYITFVVEAELPYTDTRTHQVRTI